MPTKSLTTPARVRSSNGSLVLGLLEFDIAEASYIRAAAGNLLAACPVSPCGITAVGGARWLLEAEGGDIIITRHGVPKRLNPGQVMLAFNLAAKL